MIRGVWSPLQIGGSFTCLVNWTINRIYTVFWNNSRFVYNTEITLDLVLANLIRTQAVLGFDRRLGATPRFVLQQYYSIFYEISF